MLVNLVFWRLFDLTNSENKTQRINTSCEHHRDTYNEPKS